MKNFFKNKIIKNKKGQMAIFIAIIFQVLFVLFAMSINVALVVHDKVNLQNSVDLAAYYAAQKQAELLNVIAHQNYQVRQAWKLLAWRYRVLGQYGVGSDFKGMPAYHPARKRAQNRDSNSTVFSPNVNASTFVDRETPIICIGYRPIWSPNTDSDQFCQERDFQAPNVFVQGRPLAVFSYGTQIAQNTLTQHYLSTVTKTCNNMVAFNYGFATSILYSFRLEQKERRAVIHGLINQMGASVADFTDLNGDSVSEGVTKMVTKNLTFNNQENVRVEYYNSLGSSTDNFFTSIDVNPRMLYTDVKGTNCQIGQDDSKQVSEYPSGGAKAKFLQWYPEGEKIYQSAQPFVFPNNLYQYSLGVEKNPWYWVYSAVKAETKTRPIFFPIGEDLTIRAKAFAKPFGGRIGPWHKETWGYGDKMSKSGEQVDKLLPSRLDENGVGQTSAQLRQDPTKFPNHGRYPGDEYGLRSHLGLNAMKNMDSVRLSVLTHYNTLPSMGTNAHDSLAPKSENPVLRDYEIAAIAPDLFDSAYYSIEPEFSKVYLEKLREKKETLLLGGGMVSNVADIQILGDLGSEPGKPIDAVDQIKISLKNKQPAPFYFINEPVHLLTGWLHGIKALDFSENNVRDRFATCDKDSSSSSYGETNGVKIPGGCLKDGGRTGYSVKLFSGKIFKEPLKLGGTGSSGGLIKNRPDDRIW